MNKALLDELMQLSPAERIERSGVLPNTVAILVPRCLGKRFALDCSRG